MYAQAKSTLFVVSGSALAPGQFFSTAHSYSVRNLKCYKIFFGCALNQARNNSRYPPSCKLELTLTQTPFLTITTLTILILILAGPDFRPG